MTFSLMRHSSNLPMMLPIIRDAAQPKNKKEQNEWRRDYVHMWWHTHNRQQLKVLEQINN